MFPVAIPFLLLWLKPGIMHVNAWTILVCFHSLIKLILWQPVNSLFSTRISVAVTEQLSGYFLPAHLSSCIYRCCKQNRWVIKLQRVELFLLKWRPLFPGLLRLSIHGRLKTFLFITIRKKEIYSTGQRPISAGITRLSFSILCSGSFYLAGYGNGQGR